MEKKYYETVLDKDLKEVDHWIVDEIKKVVAEYSDYDMSKEGQSQMWKTLNYWQEVKEKIETL